MHKHVRTALVAIVLLFAAIGLVFTGVFLAMQFGLFNVPGAIKERNAFFLGQATATSPAAVASARLPEKPCVEAGVESCAWNGTPEWDVVEGGLLKDAAVIERVSHETGVPARLIAASVIPEQIRFFTAEREVFKRYFEPLKILGSLSQFSLGVSGIKQETARLVELQANDPSSPFYPGPEAARLLRYPAGTKDADAALFARLTDEKDHYYSYLYTALYLKEVEAQWEKAGFDVSDDPYALVTLFNIGFKNSVPKEDPKAGGAQIAVGGRTYVFGELGGDFFVSDEMLDVFPR
ncbi:MAG: hypothetical protein V4644_03530 [Patescibacteria group bacterium]